VPHPEHYPRTPDGRYFVVRGRLWRASNPALDPAEREQLVRDLMAARRAVRGSKGDPVALATARDRVDAAKRALGERVVDRRLPRLQSAHGGKHPLCGLVRFSR
jgi:hypothetical protein